MAITGRSITTTTTTNNATSENVTALITKVKQIDKLLNHQLENHVTSDDIETEDILHNTER